MDDRDKLEALQHILKYSSNTDEVRRVEAIFREVGKAYGMSTGEIMRFFTGKNIKRIPVFGQIFDGRSGDIVVSVANGILSKNYKGLRLERVGSEAAQDERLTAAERQEMEFEATFGQAKGAAYFAIYNQMIRGQKTAVVASPVLMIAGLLAIMAMALTASYFIGLLDVSSIKEMVTYIMGAFQTDDTTYAKAGSGILFIAAIAARSLPRTDEARKEYIKEYILSMISARMPLKENEFNTKDLISAIPNIGNLPNEVLEDILEGLANEGMLERLADGSGYKVTGKGITEGKGIIDRINTSVPGRKVYRDSDYKVLKTAARYDWQDARKYLAESMANIVMEAHDKGVKVVVQQGVSAAPAAYLFVETWKRLYPKEAVPEIIVLGEEAGSVERGKYNRESVRKRLTDQGIEKYRSSPVLVLDELYTSGLTHKTTKEVLGELGIAKVYTAALMARPDETPSYVPDFTMAYPMPTSAFYGGWNWYAIRHSSMDHDFNPRRGDSFTMTRKQFDTFMKDLYKDLNKLAREIENNYDMEKLFPDVDIVAAKLGGQFVEKTIIGVPEGSSQDMIDAVRNVAGRGVDIIMVSSEAELKAAARSQRKFGILLDETTTAESLYKDRAAFLESIIMAKGISSSTREDLERILELIKEDLPAIERADIDRDLRAKLTKAVREGLSARIRLVRSMVDKRKREMKSVYNRDLNAAISDVVKSGKKVATAITETVAENDFYAFDDIKEAERKGIQSRYFIYGDIYKSEQAARAFVRAAGYDDSKITFINKNDFATLEDIAQRIAELSGTNVENVGIRTVAGELPAAKTKGTGAAKVLEIQKMTVNGKEIYVAMNTYQILLTILTQVKEGETLEGKLPPGVSYDDVKGVFKYLPRAVPIDYAREVETYRNAVAYIRTAA